MQALLTVSVVIGTLGVLFLVYSIAFEPFAIRMSRVRMFCPRLPKDFDGFTILQISDLHMSQMGLRERRLKKLIQASRPDILVLTGDLVGDEASARQLIDIALSASPKEGIFAISGNSDLRYPETWAVVRKRLKDSGIILLENSHHKLRRAASELVIAGVDDPHTSQDDLGAALKGVSSEQFVLLLAHSPAIAVPAVECGADVVLCGHTHGGQLAFPMVGPLMTRSGHGKQMSSGHYEGRKLEEVIEINPKHTQIYTTRGVGVSFVPLRFLCPPEVTMIELLPSGQ